MGFSQESLRWWDHWLKGKDTGLMAEPMLRSWILESEPPATHYAERKGHWVADPSWPSPYVSEQLLHLNSDGAANVLTDAPDTSVTLDFCGQLSHGFDSGEWGSFGHAGEFPPDQRTADGECLAFTSAPVREAIAILGNPEVDLCLAVDKPQALVAVRLCDVAPDGVSTLVSWGMLNLSHRESHEEPTPVQPGTRYRVTVQMRMMGYSLAAGHRWRVGISPTFTRHAWPSPQLVRLRLYTGEGCRLRLPVRSPQATDGRLPAFPPVEHSPPLPLDIISAPRRENVIAHDRVNGWTTLTQVSDEGRMRFSDHGLEVAGCSTETFRVRDGDPLSVRLQIRAVGELQRADWRVRVETDSVMTADATHFHVSNQLDAYECDTRVFTKSWVRAIPRDQM
jgi:hypothetical protein